MIVEEKLASRGAKDILVKIIADQNLNPQKYAEENHWCYAQHIIMVGITSNLVFIMLFEMTQPKK